MMLLAAKNESLEKHTEDVTDEVANRFLERRARTLVRIVKPEVNFSLSDAKRALLYTAIFHDIGKAYDWFQDTLAEKDTAPRHELFSAFVASRILKENAFSSSSQFLRNCVLLTIAWHHYVTRGMVLPEIAETTPRFVPVKFLRLSEQRKLELVEILCSVLKKYRCEDGVDLSELPESISRDDNIKKLVDELQDVLESRDANPNGRLYFATLPVLSALQVADSLVAYRNRGTGELQIHTTDLVDPLLADKVRKALWSVGR